MSFTRFYDDDSRIKKRLQESTDISRYILNVPGNGSNPNYFEDPYIRLDKWGANLYENKIDIDGELKGLGKKYNRDCIDCNKDNIYSRYNLDKNKFPMQKTTTQESRTTHPHWELYGKENKRWDILFYNPQNNIYEPLEKTSSTRIIEKNNFIAKFPNI